MLDTFFSLFSGPCTWWFNKWGDKDWSPCCDDHDDGWEKFDLAYDRAGWKFLED